jgi:sulfide:quinone oxidoreductase
VDIDFLSGPNPTGVFHPPDTGMRARKEHFAASRRARWFGM